MLVDVDEHNFCGAKHEASESLSSQSGNRPMAIFSVEV